MSRRRNRNHSASLSFAEPRNGFASLNNKSLAQTHQQSTLYTTSKRPQSKEEVNNRRVYTKNISLFRKIFNPNDPSQLPFMSSLRVFIIRFRPKTTVAEPFEVSLKTTCNQLIKKRVSDFSAKTIRLSPAYYRWHNQSGRNNRWSSQFQCSLRDYGDSKNPEQQKFYPYVKPIVYQDFEQKQYNKNELICHRHIKSFKIKVNDL